MNDSNTICPVTPVERCRVSYRITEFSVNEVFVDIIVESLPSGVLKEKFICYTCFGGANKI